MAAASLNVMNLPQAIDQQHTQPMQSHTKVGSGNLTMARQKLGWMPDITALQMHQEMVASTRKTPSAMRCQRPIDMK
jgi:hypothetical protein